MNVVMWPWGQGPQQVIPLVVLYSVSQREKQRRLQGSRAQRVRMDDLASKKIMFTSWFYLSLSGRLGNRLDLSVPQCSHLLNGGVIVTKIK